MPKTFTKRLGVLHPALGAKLTTEKYGKDLGLDTAEQQLEVEAENLLIWTADTKANGVFTVTDKLVTENIEVLKKGGLTLTAAQLFDFSLLAEVYAKYPALKVSPK